MMKKKLNIVWIKFIHLEKHKFKQTKNYQKLNKNLMEKIFFQLKPKNIRNQNFF
jgi:hypothetical protein